MCRLHPQASWLRCLLLIFHRQTSLAVQSKTTLEQEGELLRAHNSCLLHEVQMANKKAMHYLDDLRSAELDLWSHKEELLRLKSEYFSSQQCANVILVTPIHTRILMEG